MKFLLFSCFISGVASSLWKDTDQCVGMETTVLSVGSSTSLSNCRTKCVDYTSSKGESCGGISYRSMDHQCKIHGEGAHSCLPNGNWKFSAIGLADRSNCRYTTGRQVQQGVHSVQGCTKACLRQSSCTGFNFKTDNENGGICETLSQSGDSACSTASGWDYYTSLSCPRGNFCTHSGGFYEFLDADGDNVKDHVCGDGATQLGVLMSAGGCASTWPDGYFWPGASLSLMRGDSACGVAHSQSDWEPLNKAACMTAVRATANLYTFAAKLNVGNWNHVPYGCSAQWKKGKMWPHWNVRTNPTGVDNGFFRLCKHEFGLADYNTKCQGAIADMSSRECERVLSTILPSDEDLDAKGVIFGNWGHVPSGCLFKKTDNRAYYNSNANGAAHSNFKQVCAYSGSELAAAGAITESSEVRDAAGNTVTHEDPGEWTLVLADPGELAPFEYDGDFDPLTHFVDQNGVSRTRSNLGLRERIDNTFQAMVSDYANAYMNHTKAEAWRLTEEFAIGTATATWQANIPDGATTSACQTTESELDQMKDHFNYFVDQSQEQIDEHGANFIEKAEAAEKLEGDLGSMKTTLGVLTTILDAVKILPPAKNFVTTIQPTIEEFEDRVISMHTQLRNFNAQKTTPAKEKVDEILVKNQEIAEKIEIAKFTFNEYAYEPFLVFDKFCDVVTTNTICTTPVNNGLNQINSNLQAVRDEVDSLRDFIVGMSGFIDIIDNFLKLDEWKVFQTFMNYMSVVFNPIDAFLNMDVCVTVPVPTIEKKEVCFKVCLLTVNMCKKRIFGGVKINVPCGLRKNCFNDCINLPYPTIKNERFCFKVKNIVNGVLNVVNFVMDALMDAVTAMMPPLPTFNLPGLPSLNLPSLNLPSPLAFPSFDFPSFGFGSCVLDNGVFPLVSNEGMPLAPLLDCFSLPQVPTTFQFQCPASGGGDVTSDSFTKQERTVGDNGSLIKGVTKNSNEAACNAECRSHDTCVAFSLRRSDSECKLHSNQVTTNGNNNWDYWALA